MSCSSASRSAAGQSGSSCSGAAGGAAWATAAGSFRDTLRYRIADASRSLRPAVEAAASGPAAERLAGLRGRLQGHLQASGLVDGPALLQQLRGSAMWEEQVLLHSKVRRGQIITIMCMHEKGVGQVCIGLLPQAARLRGRWEEVLLRHKAQAGY